MSERLPGPEVAVNARAPFQLAPSTMPMAASSSFGLDEARSSSCPSRIGPELVREGLVRVMTDVEGVIGYHAAHGGAREHAAERPAAVLPSMRM
jgi:hypothetical protein